MLGSSLATMISGAPFLGPIAGVKVGYIDGEYIINPTVEELEKSSLDLTVAGTSNAINMEKLVLNKLVKKLCLKD